MLGIKDSTTQQILLRERNLTLEKTIDICRAAENAMLQGKMFRAETINKVDALKEKAKTVKAKLIGLHCKYCGRQHANSENNVRLMDKTGDSVANQIILLNNAKTGNQPEHL